MTTSPDRLSRTRAALAEWDRMHAELSARGHGTWEALEPLWKELDAQETKVKEAFALDTADVNSRERAMLIGWSVSGYVGDECWLRRRLAETEGVR